MSHLLHTTHNLSLMLGSEFTELFLVGATNNLPAWGTIVDHNASAKMFLPEQCTPSVY